MSDEPNFDEWGKPETVSKTTSDGQFDGQPKRHRKKSKKPKTPLSEKENETVNENPARTEILQQMQTQLQIALNRIQQIEQTQADSIKLIEQNEVMAYIEQNGPQSLITWLTQINRQYAVNFITQLVNHFKFSKQKQDENIPNGGNE